MKTGAARALRSGCRRSCTRSAGKNAIAEEFRHRHPHDFARFAISNLDRIDDARALAGGDDETIHQTKHGFGKAHVEQRLRGRELEDLAVLKEPVEAAFAQIEEARLNRVGRQPGLGRFLLSARLLGALLFGSRHVRLNREKNIQASPFAQGEQAVGDFVHRILFHFLPA
jgi:hypothetical protein